MNSARPIRFSPARQPPARHAIPLALLGLCAAPMLSLAQPDPKVLYLGVDGLRPDAMLLANTPNIDRLIAAGAFATDASCEDLTFSGPGWSSILHGVHREKHNVTSNGYGGNNLAQYPDFLEYIERDDASLSTVRITTWDQIYINQPTGADVDIFHNYTSNGDLLAANAAVDLLLGTHPSHPGFAADAMFLYFADVDIAGHTCGFHPSRQCYLDEIESTDNMIGWVLDAVEARPTYADESWIIILTSDHGGSSDGGHGGNTPEKRTVPFIVSGPDAVAGAPFPAPKIVDGVATALAHMGVPVTPQMDLDGDVVGLSPSSPPEATFGVNLIYNADGEADPGFLDQGIHQVISGWYNPGPSGLTLTRWNAPGGFPGDSDPGPDDRGSNFFCGGAAVETYAIQTIDVSPLAGQLDLGGSEFALSAWLGGYSSQNDRAQLRVRFLAGDGSELGTAQLGPVTNADRGNATALLLREARGEVPVSTRTVEVELRCFRDAGGGNDGYADSISLVLESGSCGPSDINSDGVVDTRDFIAFLDLWAQGCD